MVGAAWELTGLLEATSASPSGNSVIGGVLAIVIANWVPHLIENHSQADGESRPAATTRPAARRPGLAVPDASSRC